MRSHIIFASTYPPVVCGVGTYTSYVAGAMPPGRASVVAFDPERYGAPVDAGYAPQQPVPVTYALDRPLSDPERLAEAVAAATPAPPARTVLWFQHTSDIWPGFDDVLRALRDFPAPKVASLHGVHFQSRETRWGLWSSEHRLLRAALPLLDRVTVFTPSAREAVCRAFPEHAARVSVLRHGLPVPPQLDRADARRCLAEYVGGLPGSVRPRGAARDLIDALADPGCLFVGALGFLQHDKGFEAAYRLRDALQARAPHRRIVALVMGSLRDPNDRRNRRVVARLAADADGRGRFLVTALPPDAVFHAALRAMDLNVFWPESPTQSGRIAHALGVGATVVGRDIEGVGETLRADRRAGLRGLRRTGGLRQPPARRAGLHAVAAGSVPSLRRRPLVGAASGAPPASRRCPRERARRRGRRRRPVRARRARLPSATAGHRAATAGEAGRDHAGNGWSPGP